MDFLGCRWWRDPQAARCSVRLAAVPAGGLVALVTLTYTMSYAALVFSGGLAPAYGIGLSSMLMGCVLAGVLTAVFSSIPFAVSAPDSNVVAILRRLARPAGLAGGRTVPTRSPWPRRPCSRWSWRRSPSAWSWAASAWPGRGAWCASCPSRSSPASSAPPAGSWWWAGPASRPDAGLAGPARPGAAPPLAAALAGGAALLAVTSRRGGPFSLPWLILGGVLLHHAIAAWLGADLAAQAAAGWLPAVPDAARTAPALGSGDRSRWSTGGRSGGI